MIDPRQADFGFSRVAWNEKKERVRAVFDTVAERYDLMNDLMSAGVHRLWKNSLVSMLNPRSGWRHLDVAGGTGDIAFRVLEKVGPGGWVTVCDINASMLEIGRRRSIDRGLLTGLDWVCGDAEALPAPDRSVDAYTIAFGLRNVTDLDAALREAHRVLKPGGRFLCLEFSKPALPGLRRLYDAYSFKLLPRIGGIVVGDADSYRYLVESIRRFPDRATLASRVSDAGLDRVSCRNLSGGIAAIHSAWRL